MRDTRYASELILSIKKGFQKQGALKKKKSDVPTYLPSYLPFFWEIFLTPRPDFGKEKRPKTRFTKSMEKMTGEKNLTACSPVFWQKVFDMAFFQKVY
jgi:hypothetical protein